MSQWDIYQSPFTWRYASPQMRQIWSEQHKRELWRKIWLALAETQHDYGLVTSEQLEDLRQHAGMVNVTRSLEIEAEIHHDLMAELKAYAEQCLVGGGILHLGATSMDIEDNADILRLKASLDLLLRRLDELLMSFAHRIEETAAIPAIGYTHLQPAEPTTLGYRLAGYAQNLLTDRSELHRVRNDLRSKGFKGAVGSGAAYAELIGTEHLAQFEQSLSHRLDLAFYPVTSQTYPRKQDTQVLNALAGIAESLHKFAFDCRILQSPMFGEWAEPFGKRQVGSSAMPFKRNPILSEKIDSLARLLSSMPQIAWNNAANSLLERTLDDSANRRSLLPEACLIADEILITAVRLISGLTFSLPAIQRNLSQYAPFAATERILMALAQAGLNRQDMHEKLRSLSLAAWSEVQAGKPNPLTAILKNDPEIKAALAGTQLEALLEVDHYTGMAEDRARAMAEQIKRTISAG